MTTEREVAAIREYLEGAPRNPGGRPLHSCDAWLELLFRERDQLLAVVDGAKEFAEWHGYGPRLISEALRNDLAAIERVDSDGGGF